MKTQNQTLNVKLALTSEEKQIIDMHIEYCAFVSKIIENILNFQKNGNSIKSAQEIVKDFRQMKKLKSFDFLSNISAQEIDNIIFYTVKIFKKYLKNKITEDEKNKLLNINFFVLKYRFYIKNKKLYFAKNKNGISFIDIKNKFCDIKSVKIYKENDEYFSEIIINNKLSVQTININDNIEIDKIENKTDYILNIKKQSLQNICDDYFKNKNNASFDKLISETYIILKKYLWTLSKNENEIEDILHDSIVKIIENIDKYDSRWNFSTWVYTICRNIFYQYKNRSKKINDDIYDCEIDINDDSFSVEVIKEKIKKETLYNKLETMINSLPDRYSIFMKERYINNMKIKDISNKYDIKEDISYKSCAYGKKLIQKILDAEQNETLQLNYMY